MRVNRQTVTLYRVLRNKRLPPTSRFYDVTTVEAEGLCWEAAKTLSERLQREEAESKPLQTSWTYDIFFCEREDAAKSRVGMRLRVSRRRKRNAAAVARPSAPQPAQLVIQW